MPLTLARAILYGGLTVGALDLIDAFVFFGLRSGARPMGILHSIAAGFLGRDAARAGGVSTAIVGFLSHFLVAFCIVTVYVLMSRVIPSLRKQWVVCGIAFGVAAYFVMTWFVVPMSNAGNGTITYALPATPIMINGILIHMFGVGLPAAFFASRVRR
jgi:glucan phosphoethanolaminetransferase (alkaline phosphatase superfamily)